MKRLAILGASGHGKVVADAALAAGWAEVVFFDDAWPGRDALGSFPIAGSSTTLGEQHAAFDGFLVAIGHNPTRLARHRELLARGARAAIVVHPRAVVSPTARLGRGTVVFAGAIVNPDARVGEACIVNTSAVVEHDCDLGDGVHLSPGALLAGGVRVGSRAWVGIGAAVRQMITIGEDAIVGAGAAVVRDVPAGTTAVGVPARSTFKHRGTSC